MNVYSLHDRKLRQYGALMLERNDFGIQRGLGDGINNNSESLLAKHPGDFDLYQVANFDDESGVIQAILPPRLVVNVAELVPADDDAGLRQSQVVRAPREPGRGRPGPLGKEGVSG